MPSSPAYVLAVLFSINLLNYIDRQALYAVFPLVKADLHLSDTRLGALASAFMLVYMCAAPVAGWWGDRTARNRWLAGGVGTWSVATIFSGLSRTYGQLLAARSAVGVGEACYGSLSYSFIAEYFSAARRGSVLAIFSMATPVGSALGYVLGGLLGQRFGWRTAFYMVGVPGLLAALLAGLLKDPRPPEFHAGKPASLDDYRILLREKVFVYDTLAGAAMTFALGGMAAWMPSYFVRTWGVSVAEAGTYFGGVTVAAGALGSLIGGWAGDKLLKVTPKAYFLLSGWGFFAGIPFGAALLAAAGFKSALACLFMAEFFIFLNTGPLNALIVNYTPLAVRSMAFAANIFVIHALGDAFSPALIGWVSDTWSLKAGLMMTLAALFLAGALCLRGARHAVRPGIGQTS